ncbi:uncharacterized protein LOC132162876 [Corylus avellana]|uniref:uncharacterized protein LOC132162876 n=1 Tax=Corylus avellana TaxID=13451 RepID=UPI00286B8C51|nr:uncharacterized protein LOC132162876 [Corylus avellana]
MARQMANGKEKSIGGELMENTNLPLTTRVMNFPLPDKFKMPRVSNYDGIGDPTEHMESLRVQFILHGTLDEISCTAFPLTLAGRKKNPAYLLSLVQGKDESLKEFMLRFNKEKLTIESPNEQTILDDLMHEVRAKGPLMAELAKSSKLVTLSQFMNKAKEYINQEKTVKALMKSQREEIQAKGSAGITVPASFGKKEEKNVKKSGKKTAPSYPRMDPQKLQSPRFTPLNTSMTKVFMEIRRDPAFKWPSKLKGDPKRHDPQKFCEYYRDHRQLTE